MKKIIIANCVLAVFVLLAISCNNQVTEQPKVAASEPNELSQGDLIARGKYLITAIGCNDCHTPKKMSPQGPVYDSTKLLSGHPAGSPLPPIDQKALQPGNWVLFAGDLTVAVGPWGISYSANLTPDSTTGIGMWTEEVFVKTLRSGKHLGQAGGRPIMPPMPWQGMAALTDEDLKAVYTFLRAIPAIHNKVPEYVSPPEVAKMK